MPQDPFDALLRLPAQDRLDLAQRLWDSLGPETDPGVPLLAIPEWQIGVLEERNADLLTHPEAEEDWETAEAELWPSR